MFRTWKSYSWNGSQNKSYCRLRYAFSLDQGSVIVFPVTNAILEYLTDLIGTVAIL
jgi:hypothetical protein